jgi:hypothetical protein
MQFWLLMPLRFASGYLLNREQKVGAGGTAFQAKSSPLSGGDSDFLKGRSGLPRTTRRPSMRSTSAAKRPSPRTKFPLVHVDTVIPGNIHATLDRIFFSI